ncbi:MAG TPA: ATP-binding protein [Acetobacteraceae bacterium]|nr:ATP-binding protein [Acetobacteraceae bacterium]
MSTDAASWQTANQAALLAALSPVFAALRRHIGEPESIDPGTQFAPPLDPPSAIDRLPAIFGLSPFESAVLLLCAGVELDGRFAEACAIAQGDPRKCYATFGLALAALPDAHWSALSRNRPLRHWRLVEMLPGDTLASAPLRIDERILHLLAGVESSDERLDGLIAAMPPAYWQSPPSWIADAAAFAARALAAPGSRVLLTGRSAGDRAVAAAEALRRNGLRPYVLQAADIPVATFERTALARQWSREARLVEAGLCVQLADAAETRPLLGLLAQIDVPVLVESDENVVPAGLAAVRVAVPSPSAAERRAIWADSIGPLAARINGALDAVADQFNLDTSAIYSVSASLALQDAETDDDGLGRAAWRIGRAHARRSLEQLARRIEPKADWDSLVLPEAQTRTLRQIAMHVRNRITVLERWGFAARYSRGLGVTALFSGASGTGKTMAAEVLAHTLDLDLFQIDLAGLVSKYIGETEKNLRRVFDAAEDSGAILLFDEADALFGKRSEVKDSHDRYANLEVSYLLQRMEAYRGLAILTTNMRHAIDPAFLRRLRFLVEFPFPDVAERARIWQRVLPAATPQANLDPIRLAQLGVAGGVIRNIAMHAAFLAADAAEPVRMSHMLAAARTEYAKLERPLGRAETAGWI